MAYVSIDDYFVEEVELPGKSKEPKEFRDIKAGMKILPVDGETLVVVAAVDKSGRANKPQRFAAGKKGIPIGGYVIDGPTGDYLFNCVEYILLGYVPGSFRMEMEGVGRWSVTVPIPEPVLKKLFSAQQKADLKRFRSRYSETQCDLEFLQITSHN
jgi:hypothetical protein